VSLFLQVILLRSGRDANFSISTGQCVTTLTMTILKSRERQEVCASLLPVLLGSEEQTRSLRVAVKNVPLAGRLVPSALLDKLEVA